MTRIPVPPVPREPIASFADASAYAALAHHLAAPETRGVGAWCGDPEILRLACLEKLRRDGPRARAGKGFTVSFIAWPGTTLPWAAPLVRFWDEGLGRGWNLYIFAFHPYLLLRIVEQGFGPARVFTPFPLPARLPGYACELVAGHAFCVAEPGVPALSDAERACWEACLPAELR